MKTTDTIASMMLKIPAIKPSNTVNDVAQLFLSEDFKHLLSIPIVDAGQPVGLINRYDLNKVYLKMYGRELYGKQAIAKLMTKAVIVDKNQMIEAASHHITQHIRFPIMEDFVVTEEGQYVGVGIVLDLLKAMETRVLSRTKELSKAYQSLKESQAQLVQSEKMASLGQMVAGVAHEINTPLGYVRNNVEVTQGLFGQAKDLIENYAQLVTLLTDDEIEEEVLGKQLALVGELSEPFLEDDLLNAMDELFKDSLYGVDQISELVLNLKDFSRLDQAKTDHVDLNQCIDSALNIGRNILKYKVTIKKKYGHLPPLKGAPSQLNQVFLNLLTNGAQAIQDKGTIWIKTWADDNGVYISIQDNGKGIPATVMKRIFDPFFTTKPVGEGTGLGLSISYKIIEQHNGQIKVASTLNKGTKFLITLPLNSDKAIQSLYEDGESK